MNKEINNDVIDIQALVQKLWKGKWIIILVTALAMILALAYHSTIKNTFLAKIEIKAIPANEQFKYQLLNSFGNEILFVKHDFSTPQVGRNGDYNNAFKFEFINKELLLNLFVETLQHNDTFDKAKNKFDLLNVSSIDLTILELISSDVDREYRPISQKIHNEVYLYIEFENKNLENLYDLLRYVESTTNDQIRSKLNASFYNLIKNKEILNQYKIEDLENTILATFKNYEKSTLTRLAFLSEQAEMARALELKSSILTTYKGKQGYNYEDEEGNYYMNGYEMIEKEMELINRRSDKKYFIKNLINLEAKKKLLEQNREVKRIKSIFEETPIGASNNFKAVQIIDQAISYTSTKAPILKILITAALLGVISSIFILLIANKILIRK
tara:strand:- start:1181 stop:2338 length:1158 start_codon:yes stop_codon:yes gene_type:complete